MIQGQFSFDVVNNITAGLEQKGFFIIAAEKVKDWHAEIERLTAERDRLREALVQFADGAEDAALAIRLPCSQVEKIVTLAQQARQTALGNQQIGDKP